MEKVYCEKCKWDWAVAKCGHPNTRCEFDTAYAHETQLPKIYEKNKNNDCPDFEKQRISLELSLGLMMVVLVVAIIFGFIFIK